MRKRRKNISTKITIADYIKAVKIADWESQKANNPGWISTDRIHPNKKIYNRRANKKIEE